MIKCRSITCLCAMQEACFNESQISMFDQATWFLSAGMIMERSVTLKLRPQRIRSLTQTSSGQAVRVILHSSMVTSMSSTEFMTLANLRLHHLWSDVFAHISLRRRACSGPHLGFVPWPSSCPDLTTQTSRPHLIVLW